MSVKITDNTVQIKGQFGQRGNVFLRLFADDVMNQARSTTPMQMGNLRRDILRQISGLHGKISWVKEYASFQERGARKDGSHRVRKYSTPGTGKGFAKRGIDGAVANIQKTMKTAGII